MALFLLTPLRPEDPGWTLSAIVCPVQVEAEDEHSARHAAADQLCRFQGLSDADSLFPNPWLRVDQVHINLLLERSDQMPYIEAMKPRGKPGRPNKQFFYLLTPRSEEAIEWEFSTRCERICVKARSSSHARAIAAMHFDMNPADRQNYFPPWWSPRLVSVEEVPEPPEGVHTIDSKDRPARFGFRIRPKG